MRIVIWIAWSGVFLLGVLFTVPNAHLVQLNYYLGSTEIRLAVLLLATLIAGSLLGILFNLSWLLRLRYQNSRLRRQCQRLEHERAPPPTPKT